MTPCQLLERAAASNSKWEYKNEPFVLFSALGAFCISLHYVSIYIFMWGFQLFQETSDFPWLKKAFIFWLVFVKNVDVYSRAFLRAAALLSRHLNVLPAAVQHEEHGTGVMSERSYRWWWGPAPRLFSSAAWRGRFRCWAPLTLWKQTRRDTRGEKRSQNRH